MSLKELFDKTELTHEEIADKVGVSTASIYNWKHGIAEPNEENKEKPVKVLGGQQTTMSRPTQNRRKVKVNAVHGASRKLHGLTVTLFQAGPHLIAMTQDKKALVIR